MPLRRQRAQWLSVDGDGLVVHQLKHPSRDGTTHVLFEPLDFIARLAALVPRPRVHLVRYHDLFAPNAKHRDHIVARHPPTAQPGDDILEAKPTTAMSWMQRLRRVFAIDISTCARCGGKVRVIAAITQSALITRILKHRAAVDAPGAGARAPPGASAALAAALALLSPSTDGAHRAQSRATLVTVQATT